MPDVRRKQRLPASRHRNTHFAVHHSVFFSFFVLSAQRNKEKKNQIECLFLEWHFPSIQICSFLSSSSSSTASRCTETCCLSHLPSSECGVDRIAHAIHHSDPFYTLVRFVYLSVVSIRNRCACVCVAQKGSHNEYISFAFIFLHLNGSRICCLNESRSRRHLHYAISMYTHCARCQVANTVAVATTKVLEWIKMSSSNR